MLVKQYLLSASKMRSVVLRNGSEPSIRFKKDAWDRPNGGGGRIACHSRSRCHWKRPCGIFFRMWMGPITSAFRNQADRPWACRRPDSEAMGVSLGDSIPINPNGRPPSHAKCGVFLFIVYKDGMAPVFGGLGAWLWSDALLWLWRRLWFMAPTTTRQQRCPLSPLVKAYYSRF